MKLWPFDLAQDRPLRMNGPSISVTADIRVDFWRNSLVQLVDRSVYGDGSLCTGDIYWWLW